MFLSLLDGGADYDQPRGQDFWLAGYRVATGKRTWYHLNQNEWSVHYNVSPDGTLFAGDGGDSEMVARAPDGQWIYLFTPEVDPDCRFQSALFWAVLSGRQDVADYLGPLTDPRLRDSVPEALRLRRLQADRPSGTLRPPEGPATLPG